jgi:cyclic pyranopterin phosphate synthase
MEEKNYLTPEQIKEIVAELTQYGLEELRLTGGEPLMRKNFSEIAFSLSQFSLKLGLTTNGIFLDRYFDVLKKSKINHLNISLDSLDEENFKKITFGNHFHRVIENTLEAKRLGFQVKINTVAMRGINHHEVEDFIKFSEDNKIEVRFLELMRIGYACGEQKDQFISADELIKKIHRKLIPVNVALDSTSFNFTTEFGGKIGFIASESKPFCGQCSRWRLSADGVMRACLLKDDGISIKNKNLDERVMAYQTLLGMKPAMRPAEVSHQMNRIGG